MEKTEQVAKPKVKVGSIALILTILFAAVYLVSILSFSGEYFSESAEQRALIRFDSNIESAEAMANVHFANLEEVGKQLDFLETKEEVNLVLKKYIGSEQFGDLRYFSSGICYSATGLPLDTGSEEIIAELAEGGKSACSKLYLDASTQQDCLAFYINVRGSSAIDGLASIVPARSIINLSGITDELASVHALVNSEGKVLSSAEFNELSTSVGNNFLDFIDNLTHDAATVTAVRDSLVSEKTASLTIDVMGERYTVVSSPVKTFDGNLLLVTMSISEGLVSTEMTYIRHVVTLLLVTLVSLFIALILAFVFDKKAKVAMSTANLTDDAVGCPNAEQFRRTARDLIYSDEREYAVVAIAIKQFHYLNDSLGYSVMTEILRSTAKILSTFCDKNETFGYADEGKFLCLYKKDSEKYLRDKIRLIGTLANKHSELAKTKTVLRFDVGVCFTDGGKRRAIKELIECAIAACSFTKKDKSLPYVVYTEEVNEKIAHDQKIEAQMEEALATGDFKLFLQPKYNVKNDRIDSAEALVRWFDSKKGTYRFPGEFIGLFEQNGFIIKLDHFIYHEVLKYLSHAAEHGDPIVPVAVNVSRVTASNSDFLDFYIGNKHKYNIGDGFLTLEFTESFAMEDYDNIYHIVERLHSAGIKCSIDDFGSGYSSFNILKNVLMDELKLDSFFLREGIDKERDHKILATAMELAKHMKMTVVQEGVETKEMFDKVVSMGCDVIQGYYYAKAIPLEEYKIFLKTNTSIKYKSYVK